MTTKVLIVNYGPHHVMLAGMVPGSETEQSKFNPGSAAIVHPNSCAAFWLHDTQALIVSEEKTPP
jgi:hypothetical protein